MMRKGKNCSSTPHSHDFKTSPSRGGRLNSGGHFLANSPFEVGVNMTTFSVMNLSAGNVANHHFQMNGGTPDWFYKTIFFGLCHFFEFRSSQMKWRFNKLESFQHDPFHKLGVKMGKRVIAFEKGDNN